MVIYQAHTLYGFLYFKKDFVFVFLHLCEEQIDVVLSL